MESSFAKYAAQARAFAAKAAAKTEEPWFKMMVATVLIPALVFLVLSPGMVLNVPKNSAAFCAEKIPLPTGETGAEAKNTRIMAAREKCENFMYSGYTSTRSAFIHGFVYVAAMYFINGYLRRSGYAPSGAAR